MNRKSSQDLRGVGKSVQGPARSSRSGGEEGGRWEGMRGSEGRPVFSVSADCAFPLPHLFYSFSKFLRFYLVLICSTFFLLSTLPFISLSISFLNQVITQENVYRFSRSRTFKFFNSYFYLHLIIKRCTISALSICWDWQEVQNMINLSISKTCRMGTQALDFRSQT